VPCTVLAIADEVSRVLYDAFQKERWANIDLIVSCGDVPPEFLDFLVSSLNVPLCYVRGNHDGTYPLSRYAGLDNVHGRIVRVGDVRVAGFEGSRRYNHGPVQYSEREMGMTLRRMRLQSIRTGPPDIIITHAPPAGPHSGHDECHGGFKTFTRAIELWRPQTLVHGHMHAYDGPQEPYMVGSCRVTNAYPYKVFEIELPVSEGAPAPQHTHRSLKRLFHSRTSHHTP
jgi:uncharacterized protein